MKGPLAHFRFCNTAVKIILFKNLLDNQGEWGEHITESSGDLLVGSTLILKVRDPNGSVIHIQKDQKVLELKAERLLSMRLLNNQS